MQQRREISLLVINLTGTVLKNGPRNWAEKAVQKLSREREREIENYLVDRSHNLPRFEFRILQRVRIKTFL